MRDSETVLLATKGARYVFHVAADYRLWAPDPGEILRTNVEGAKVVMEAAQAAGVERIVYTSFCGAAPDATFTFGRDHWHTEQRIEASGLRHTFLRDNFYLDYMPLLAGADGVIRGPAGDGRLAAVARDDVADSAAAVLLDGSGAHDGRAYAMTGPAALTLAEVAAELARTTGRQVTYHEETIEEAYESRASYGAPRWEVDGWVSTYSAIAAGDVDEVTDAVERLSGHPATDLPGFLAAHPESWAHLVA